MAGLNRIISHCEPCHGLSQTHLPDLHRPFSEQSRSVAQMAISEPFRAKPSSAFARLGASSDFTRNVMENT